jgi:O-antigen/teichoic acid export membrane protein
VRYAVPLGIGSVGMLFVHYGDRFFLQRYVSLSEIGIYALAYKIGMMTALVHGPFAQFWSVEMFKVSRDPEGDKFYVRLFSYLVLALALLGVLMGTLCRPALHILVAPDYRVAAKYIPWITVAYILRSIGDHLRSVCYTEKRTGANSKVTVVGALVCIAGYVLLIPRWGVWGAVAATVTAFAFLAAYSLYEGQRVRHYHLEYRRLSIVALASVGAAMGFSLIPTSGFWTQLAAAAASLGIFSGVIRGMAFFTDEEKDALRLFLLRLRVTFGRGPTRQTLAG